MPSTDESAAHGRHALKSRRQALAASVVVLLGAAPVHAAEKKKGKASKEDFFYQETPGEKGRHCGTCVNYEPVAGGDKGSCSLVEGEVCKNCYCQGWTDKKTGKKAGT